MRVPRHWPGFWMALERLHQLFRRTFVVSTITQRLCLGARKPSLASGEERVALAGDVGREAAARGGADDRLLAKAQLAAAPAGRLWTAAAARRGQQLRRHTAECEAAAVGVDPGDEGPQGRRAMELDLGSFLRAIWMNHVVFSLLTSRCQRGFR